jgi:hypothetical protein
MVWTVPPDGIAMSHVGAFLDRQKEGAAHMDIITIGIDLAKSVFQLHGVDAEGKVVLEKKVRRAAFLTTLENAPHKQAEHMAAPHNDQQSRSSALAQPEPSTHGSPLSIKCVSPCGLLDKTASQTERN